MCLESRHSRSRVHISTQTAPKDHRGCVPQIPAQHQRMVRFAYWSYLGFFVCITFNWFCSLMAMCVISPGDNRLAGFLLACVYWFAGLPGAWVLW